MSLFGDCAVKRAKYKPTTSALREYGICGFRAPDEDREGLSVREGPSSEEGGGSSRCEPRRLGAMAESTRFTSILSEMALIWALVAPRRPRAFS